MSTYKGRNLIISDTNGALAASKSCTVNVQAKTIETASPTQGRWTNYIFGLMSWSLSTTHLVKAPADPATGHPLRDLALRVGQAYDLTLTIDGFTADTLHGSALCTSFKVTATRGNLIQCSLEFKGNGPLQ